MPLYIWVPLRLRGIFDDPGVQVQSADCGPREFPQPLARPRYSAGALDCRAQLALVPADANADDIVVAATRLARATRPHDARAERQGDMNSCFIIRPDSGNPN